MRVKLPISPARDPRGFQWALVDVAATIKDVDYYRLRKDKSERPDVYALLPGNVLYLVGSLQSLKRLPYHWTHAEMMQQIRANVTMFLTRNGERDWIMAHPLHVEALGMREAQKNRAVRRK